MRAFNLQDPDNPASESLLEHLVDASDGARRGGAIFSYARENGIKALLSDDGFSSFLEGGTFELVVGVDGVTDERALDALIAASDHHENLVAQAFVHRRQHTTFHPKLTWFRRDQGAIAIVGSGNLTHGGLMRNWEAFLRADLDELAGADLERDWAAWKHLHGRHILELTDPIVRTACAANNAAKSRDVVDDETAPPIPRQIDLPVLLKEIPAAGDRWAQVNFHIDEFKNFFHADSRHHRLQLWQVRPDGTIADIELRPGVSVKSRNYRIELAAARGLAYPASPPLAVYARISHRAFLYYFMPPSDPQYAIIRAYMQSQWTGGGNKKMSVTLTVNQLKTVWASSPLWKHV